MNYRITIEDRQRIGNECENGKVIIETEIADRDELVELFKKGLEVCGFVFPIEEE